jgi:hypothetical protein
MIGGQITARPAFLEVYLEIDQLFYRPVSADETASEEKAPGQSAGGFCQPCLVLVNHHRPLRIPHPAHKESPQGEL